MVPHAPALPDCVRRVLELADRLHALVLTDPLPDLETPATDEDARRVSGEVISWGERVLAIYGSPARRRTLSHRRELPATLLDEFERDGTVATQPRVVNKEVSVHQPRPHAQAIARALVGASGSPFGPTHADANVIRQAFAPPATRLVSTLVLPPPRAPSLDHVADVLGDVPDPFRLPFAEFRYDPVNGRPSWLADRTGQRRQAVTTAGWTELRDVVEQRYTMAVAQCLGFVRWIRERVRLLQDGLVISIRVEASLRSGGARLGISQAGATRVVRVSKTILRLLRTLVSKGEIFATAKQKLALVDAIQELRPHLQPYSSTGKRSGNRSGLYYRAPSEVLQGIQLDAPPRRGSK